MLAARLAQVGWNLRPVFVPKDDSEILQQAALGDERSLPHYEHAIAAAGEDGSVRSVAERQMESIRTTVQQLRSATIRHQ